MRIVRMPLRTVPEGTAQGLTALYLARRMPAPSSHLHQANSFQQRFPVLWAWYTLLRPVNLLLTALAQLLANQLLAHFDGYLNALAWPELGQLMGATALLGAGGNAINALVDRDADNAHRPGSNPVGRELDLKTAGVAYGATTVGGLALGLQLALDMERPQAAWWMAAAAALLLLYSVRAQGWPILGNVVVAFLSALAVAMPPLFRSTGWPSMDAGLILGDPAGWWPSALWLGRFLILAFLASWTREWIKDLEDREADRAAFRHTAAVRWSAARNKAGIFALLALQLGAVFALALGIRASEAGLLGSLPALPIAMGYAWLAFGLVGANTSADYARLSLGSKSLMGAGVLWMGIFPLLA
jgi:4-hydroxybenzoate polyprenyltransferase